MAINISPTLEINERVEALRAAGREIVHLGFGEASFALPERLRGALGRSAASTAYGPVLGIAPLRRAIADYLTRTRGLAVAPDQVAVGPGSKPLLYALLLALEGDVLVPVPSWVSYAPQARLANKRPIPVATDERDHHRLLLPPRTEARILIVNTPSNPTGGMLEDRDVEALAGWARERGVTVISDEIYAELAHGWRPHVSPARFHPAGTIVTGGLSKAFSAGGWRLGYAVVPDPVLLGALRAIASEIWSSAAMPIQEAAIAAFTPDDELIAWVERSARLHGEVASRLHTALVELGCLCPRPAGAFYLYPDFAPHREPLAARGVRTSPELARHLLDEHGIATLPGTAFGDEPAALRLRLAVSGLHGPGQIERAEDAFARFAAALR